MPGALEERVSALEEQVQGLVQALHDKNTAGPVPDRDAWQKTVGAFQDDPLYDDAVRLGAQYRRRQPKC